MYFKFFRMEDGGKMYRRGWMSGFLEVPLIDYKERRKLAMKNFISKYGVKFGGCIAALAMMVTAATVNSACVWFTHQEKLPEEAKKLRKF